MPPLFRSICHMNSGGGSQFEGVDKGHPTHTRSSFSRSLRRGPVTLHPLPVPSPSVRPEGSKRRCPVGDGRTSRWGRSRRHGRGEGEALGLTWTENHRRWRVGVEGSSTPPPLGEGGRPRPSVFTPGGETTTAPDLGPVRLAPPPWTDPTRGTTSGATETKGVVV